MSFPLTVLVDDASFPEGPRWHAGAFWYSDIAAGHVCRVRPGGKKEIVVEGLANPSGLGWTRSGDLLVVSIHTQEVYRIGPDKMRKVLCGPGDHGVKGTNDMATSGSRSYVTCSRIGYEPGADPSVYEAAIGCILLVDHDTGECRIAADGLRFPNGIAITPDGKTLLVAEVFGKRVSKFDIGPDGALMNQGLFAQLNASPDGLALDAAGAVWVGTGGNFQNVDRTGRVLHSFEVPGWNCIAPMLGGPDGRTLFLAVCQIKDIDSIFTGGAKGQLLQTRVDVPAAPAP